MNVSAAANPYDNFFRIQAAAAQRMEPLRTTSVNNSNHSLTTNPRPVDPLLASQSAKGPVKGRFVDFIA
ncbi:MAG: hypothetical protein RL173_2565 [Fibrobacterota bacterium]|jgi:hypothetical protein